MTSPADLPPFARMHAGSFHREIDLSALSTHFRTTRLPTHLRGRIVGPLDMQVAAALRQHHGVLGRGATPCDVFLWATGEGPHRAMTKLGGLPWLPASMPWPRRHGTDADFCAQLNFVDSKDLVPELPADVLLVFRFHDLDVTSWDRELYEFLWVGSDERDLIAPESVRCSAAGAKTPWPVLHGYRVRTADDATGLERLCADPELDARLTALQATKIGGIATDCQDVRGPEVADGHRFLGQIAAVWPAVGVPYPVVDRAEPVADLPDPAYQQLVSGPGDGVTCLYLTPGGEVHVHFSCG